ncbi:MAG: hypothetical protein AAFX05_08830 [Planctomycetota bacterium]
MPVHASMDRFSIDHAQDLRRRRTRELAETLVEDARWILPDDRAVIHAIYADGMTAQNVARLRNEPPRRLRRRVRVLVSRILSDRFRFVLIHRDAWPPMRRRVAGACILQGRSMRAAAAHLHISLHAVRREMDVINALFAAATPHAAAA